MVADVTSRQDEALYARELGLDETQLLRLDLKSLQVRRVPTLVVLDRQGIVRFSWEGVPPPAAREKFVQTVTTLITQR
jgi:hypothetical protein